MDIKPINSINVTWVTRSFLDYRIPVFQCLDELVEGRLHLLFSGDYIPASVAEKAKNIIGERAIGLRGEWKVGQEDRQFMANGNISIRYQPGILKAIYRTKPDVIICDGFFKWTLPALIYRLRQGTPLVVCYERWSHTERHAQWYRILYRKIALRFIDAMCCNGRLSKEYTIRLGMPPDLITMGHMAADTEGLSSMHKEVTGSQKLSLRSEYGIEGLVCMYAGRLISSKGLEQLLDAWAGLESTVAERAGLMMVGDGPERGALEQQCRNLGLANVVFVGAVNYENIATYYAAADVFVIPTLEDNWSLVVPEAMACGLPVLCSKYNGCWPELVQEGKNGWVFDPLDSGDFVRALRAACDAKDRLTQMGGWSRDIVSQHSPEVAAQSVLDACRMAMKR